jgi:hypothetical protein
MKTLKLTFASLTLLCFLSSCHIMYIPNSQNVPMMEVKNDLKVEISTKDVQLAYAITDHIGIMANGYYNKNEWSAYSGTYENFYTSKRSLAEGGLGYYTTLSDNGRFEIYGGGGFGHVSWDYNLLNSGIETENNTFDINMMRMFIQPAIGTQGKNFGFAFSTRLAALSFSGIDTTGYTVEQLINEDINLLEGEMLMFVEPAVTLRLGMKYLQFQIQPYYNIKLVAPTNFNYKKWGVNFGIYLSIDDMFSNKD